MGYSDPRWLLHPQEVPGYSINESDLPYLSLSDDYQVLGYRYVSCHQPQSN